MGFSQKMGGAKKLVSVKTTVLLYYPYSGGNLGVQFPDTKHNIYFC